MGYGKLEDTRSLITRNAGELGTYGIIGTAPINSGKRGRPGTAYYLNEEQACLVCILARTENAAAVRKQVIATFMAYRRGQLVPVAQTPAVPRTFAEALRLAADQAEKIGQLSGVLSDLTMSSREIAELTEKEHKNVLTEIWKMFIEIGLLFSQCSRLLRT
ncbi:Rha family transcriptional regulator [Rhizobium sp. TRM95796]|uniref:Rha family transcriptional regulator n=1 Tax=Rhizobium sp. TRM95796 TaxID=2979862 RepID=UPI0021E8052E|nr:Rha family transcriptional regulator [Rhizobium sp. TRM95796]MCV3767153.1 Rha family transcriptional regulator [Rhizobium sp. TRM95796]